ncbi:MAG: Hsp20/alpha crystallin family protein [Thiohalobacterales bacterium]|nr:Hsp20/alpha crystallin family protein [Thiohalobacterales bacterium]
MASRKKDKAISKAGKAPAVVSPWDEMERWFNEVGGRGWMRPLSWEWPSRMMEEMGGFEGRMPKVDMLDRESEYVIRAELPGVKKDDIEVTLTENTVTIEASTSHEEKEEKDKYYRREISRGMFRRSLTLPGSVDDAGASADFKDGVLELTLPKTEKAAGKKVKVG